MIRNLFKKKEEKKAPVSKPFDFEQYKSNKEKEEEEMRVRAQIHLQTLNEQSPVEFSYTGYSEDMVSLESYRWRTIFFYEAQYMICMGGKFQDMEISIEIDEDMPRTLLILHINSIFKDIETIQKKLGDFYGEDVKLEMRKFHVGYTGSVWTYPHQTKNYVIAVNGETFTLRSYEPHSTIEVAINKHIASQTPTIEGVLEQKGSDYFIGSIPLREYLEKNDGRSLRISAIS